MGRNICKIPHEGKDYYLVWSTVCDSFITYGMELEEFNTWMREEEGNRYMEDTHPGRMERVEKCGTSSRMDNSVEEVIGCNRCGPRENRISIEGIIYRFIVMRGKEVDDEVMNKYRWLYTREEAGDDYEDINNR